ncbi:hypothetical protein B484DRAFT_419170 [Ochromonadaceae sp. CCMP2298]|nr:hypothetical protein B484DRAFT_419170 [Ochromonadaceae sp. CCMP2298]
MPWQTAPALIVICGAFTATGLLLRLTDYVAYGKHRRVQIDEFDWQMDRRDEKIKAINLANAKIANEAMKNAGLQT